MESNQEPTSLAKLKKSFVKIGTPIGEVPFGDSKCKIRTLNTDDDVFIYEKATSEASSELGRFALIRVYSLCLMITEMDGTSVYDAIFADAEMLGPKNNQHREELCKEFGQVLIQLDKQLIRYLFKLCWAWGEAQAFKVVKDASVESFLTPEELTLYRDLQQVLAIESAVQGSKNSVKDEQALKEAFDEFEDRADLDIGDLI